MPSDRQGRLWRAAIRASLLLILNLAFASGSQPAGADSLLTNGDFEAGATGWIGVSTDGCTPRSGTKAGALRTDAASSSAVAIKSVATSAPGAYRLTGHISATAGNVVVAMQPLVNGGPQPNSYLYPISPNTTYTPFSFGFEYTGAINQLSVRIAFTSGQPAVACVDDLVLEGPAVATPTPTLPPTNTPIPTSTTLPPTATTKPGAASTATKAPTSAPTATRTPAATSTPLPGVSATLLNGGFENGLASWQKFGGELRAVAEPRRSGASSGLLASNTSSTKWAFQVIRVDPTQAYEFAGYLRPDAGVAQAYLRISWYAAADGSGSAIATDDSTTTLPGGTGGFAYLTTGARQPPADARSARLRVMLAPAGATANLHMDDLTLVVAPPTAAVAPPTTHVAADEPVEAPAQAASLDEPAPAPAGTSSTATAPTATPRTAGSAPSAAATTVADATASATVVSEVASVRATAISTVVRSERLVQQTNDSSPLTAWLAVLALPVFAAGAGVAYLVGRRRAQ